MEKGFHEFRAVLDGGNLLDQVTKASPNHASVLGEQVGRRPGGLTYE